MFYQYLLYLAILLVFGLLSFRVYTKTNECNVDKDHIAVIKAEIETIEAGGEEFLLSSMRDKKADIHWFENPAIDKSNRGANQLERLKRQLEKMKKSIGLCDKDIGNLEERNKAYTVEVNNLQEEYELRKNEGFDMGAAHGLGDRPVNQYYFDGQSIQETSGMEINVDGQVDGDIQMDVDLGDANAEVEVEVDADVEVEVDA